MSDTNKIQRLSSLTTSPTSMKRVIRGLRIFLGYPHTNAALKDMARKNARVETLNRLHTIELVDQYAQEQVTPPKREQTPEASDTTRNEATDAAENSERVKFESLINRHVAENLCPGDKCAKQLTAHFPVDDFIDGELLVRRVQRLQPISETAFSIDCNLTYRHVPRHKEIHCDNNESEELKQQCSSGDGFNSSQSLVTYVAVPLGLFPQQQSSNLAVTDHHGRAVRVATARDGAAWTLQYMERFWPSIFADMPHDAQVALHHYIRSTRVPLALALMHIRRFVAGREWLNRHSREQPEAMRTFIDHLKVISHQRLFFALVPLNNSREWTLHVSGQKTLNFGNTHIEMSWFDLAARTADHLQEMGRLQELEPDSTSLEEARRHIANNLRNNDFQENVEDIEQVVYQTNRKKIELNFKHATLRLTGEMLRCYNTERCVWDDSAKTLHYSKHVARSPHDKLESSAGTDFLTETPHNKAGFLFTRKDHPEERTTLIDLLDTVWPDKGLSHAEINKYRCDNIFDWGWPQSDRYKVKVSDDTTIQSITRELDYPIASEDLTGLRSFGMYEKYADDETLFRTSDPSAYGTKDAESVNHRQYRLRPASRQHKDASFIYWHQGRKFFPESEGINGDDVKHQDASSLAAQPDAHPVDSDNAAALSAKPIQKMFGRPHHFLFYMMPEKSLANSMAFYTSLMIVGFIWLGVLTDAFTRNWGIHMLTGDESGSSFEVAAALLLAVSVSVIAFAGSATSKDILRRLLRQLHHFIMGVMLSSWFCLTVSFVIAQSYADQFVDPSWSFSWPVALTVMWLVVGVGQIAFLARYIRAMMFVVRPLRST